MPCRLTCEEVVSIQVLSTKQVPKRQIARQLGVSEGSVRYHLRKTASGRQDGRRSKVMRADPLAAAIEHWWQQRLGGQRPPNAQELHQHLVEEHRYEGSYRSVLRYVRRRWGRPPIRTYRRVETPPGAQSQTDWGHFQGIWIGGELVDPLTFVMTLSWSRASAIVWSLRKDQLSWIHCHNRAFERLGGIAAANRIDNEKTAVSRGSGAWGTLNPVYASYARTMCFHVDACQPREPQAKGKSEAKVKLGRSLGPKRRHYDALEELQAETDQALEGWAKRTISPVTGQPVYDTWQLELDHLRPLPPILPEPFDLVVHRRVQRDCTVNFEGRQYSVPFEYAGRTVEVRGCAGRVQLLHEDRILREYPRGTPERLLLDPTCYEGASTERVLAPPPLGRMGRRLEEIYAMPVEQRPVDLYAALAEVAR